MPLLSPKPVGAVEGVEGPEEAIVNRKVGDLCRLSVCKCGGWEDFFSDNGRDREVRLKKKGLEKGDQSMLNIPLSPSRETPDTYRRRPHVRSPPSTLATTHKYTSP